jgi:hypothetical protein
VHCLYLVSGAAGSGATNVAALRSIRAPVCAPLGNARVVQTKYPIATAPSTSKGMLFLSTDERSRLRDANVLRAMVRIAKAEAERWLTMVMASYLNRMAGGRRSAPFAA